MNCSLGQQVDYIVWPFASSPIHDAANCSIITALLLKTKCILVDFISVNCRFINRIKMVIRYDHLRKDKALYGKLLQDTAQRVKPYLLGLICLSVSLTSKVEKELIFLHDVVE